MTEITLKGNPFHTIGELPKTGSQAPNFTLIAEDLSEKSLNDFKGSKVVLNIFPSIDTGTCAQSVRKFNELASSIPNTTVLCISRDLPFAQQRFCGSESLKNVINLSDFKEGTFGKDYGLTIQNGPLAGLLSRCIVVLDENKNVIYTEQVKEIVDEPDYDSAVNSLK